MQGSPRTASCVSARHARMQRCENEPVSLPSAPPKEPEATPEKKRAHEYAINKPSAQEYERPIWRMPTGKLND